MTRVLPLIQSKSVQSATKRDCHCPECRRRRQQELEALIDGDLLLQEVPATITPVKPPTPGSFYSIKSGDTLYNVAGRAYSLPSGQRLQAARLINDHPYNLRFRDSKLIDNGQFPQGRVSYSPKFSCDLGAQRAASIKSSSGKCYATIWIPHRPGGRPQWARDGYTHPILGQTVAISATEFGSTQNISEILNYLCKPLGCKAYVIGIDDRKYIPNTKIIPYMHIGSIYVVYKVGFDFYIAGPATCFSIGKRHILTAAHVMEFFFAGEIRRAIAAWVSFGQMADSQENRIIPYGELIMEFQNQRDRVHILSDWKKSLKSEKNFNPSYDYCLIRHRGAADLFNRESSRLPLGYWGSPPAATSHPLTQIGEPAGIKTLQDGIPSLIHLAGYPCDKKCQQWESRGFITKLTSSRVFHDMDVAAGHSGSPIWREETQKTKKIYHLIGIQSAHTAGEQVAVRLKTA
jgi:V8-like Glu-specific endopeptidase